MKKLLLLTALILGMICQAQDIAYLQNLKALPTEADALNIANELAAQSATKLRLYKSKDTTTQKNLRLEYVPEELTDKDIELRNYTEAQKLNFITIDFVYYYQGENKDIEIKGVKYYRLSTVYAKYLNLFPYWKKHFNPTADVEKTLTDYKSQRIKDATAKIYYYIQKSGDVWVFHNMS